MRRRELIFGLGGAALGWPIAARAQQPKMLRVGFVGMQPRGFSVYAAFLTRMGELGYQEGRNFAFEYIQHRMLRATRRAIATLRHGGLMFSWRSETSRHCGPHLRLQMVDRSRFWPLILILWRRDMSRISHVLAAM
jgi:hypothetical protein